jgi:hypothetical protein
VDAVVLVLQMLTDRVWTAGVLTAVLLPRIRGSGGRGPLHVLYGGSFCIWIQHCIPPYTVCMWQKADLNKLRMVHVKVA